MKCFFITFGSSHPLSKHVIGIAADDEEKARTAAFEVLGKKWGFFYDANDASRERSLEGQMDQWGYELLWAFRVTDSGYGSIYHDKMDNDLFMAGVRDAVSEGEAA